jgi:hypothetical protein
MLADMKKYFIAIPLLLLSGCASFSKTEFQCPQTGFMAYADRAVFLASRDKADVAVKAYLKNLQGTCDYDKKDGAVLRFAFDVTAEKTERTQATQQNLSYFIAVLDKTENIKQSSQFYVTVPLADPAGVKTLKHEVKVPLKGKGDSANYKVAVGFSLTPEQYAFNKGGK